MNDEKGDNDRQQQAKCSHLPPPNFWVLISVRTNKNTLPDPPPFLARFPLRFLPGVGHFTVAAMSQGKRSTSQPAIIAFDTESRLKRACHGIDPRHADVVTTLVEDLFCRLPVTTHVPASTRAGYVPSKPITAPCSNRAACSEMLSSEDPECIVRCEMCHKQAYCSSLCCSSDERRHTAQDCVDSATYSGRNLPKLMTGMLDTYYGPAAKTIRKLLPFTWVTPLTAHNNEHLKRFPYLQRASVWLSLYVAQNCHGHVATDADTDEIRCMHCGGTTGIGGESLKQIIFFRDSVSAAIDRGEDDDAILSSDHPGHEAFDAITRKVRIEFYGVTDEGMIDARFTICCGEDCLDAHDPIVDPYGDCWIWTNSVTHNVSMRLVVHTPPYGDILKQ